MLYKLQIWTDRHGDRESCEGHVDVMMINLSVDVEGCTEKRLQTDVRGGITIVLIGLVGLTESWTENGRTVRLIM